MRPRKIGLIFVHNSRANTGNLFRNAVRAPTSRSNIAPRYIGMVQFLAATLKFITICSILSSLLSAKGGYWARLRIVQLAPPPHKSPLTARWWRGYTTRRTRCGRSWRLAVFYACKKGWPLLVWNDRRDTAARYDLRHTFCQPRQALPLIPCSPKTNTLSVGTFWQLFPLFWQT